MTELIGQGINAVVRSVACNYAAPIRMGDEVEVLTETGKFKTANIKNFGPSTFNRIKLNRGKTEKIFYATDDHIWFNYEWSVYLDKNFDRFVKFWNQSEVIIGKYEKVHN